MSIKRRPDRNNQWYAYFRDSDKKPHQLLIPDSENYSKKRAEKESETLISKFLGQTTPKGNKPLGRSLKAEFERYLRLHYSFKKANTLSAVRVESDLFFRHLKDDDLMAVDREEANRVAGVILGSGVSAKYWKNCLGGLKAFFKWLVEEKILVESPVAHLKAPKNSELNKVEEVWTEEEVEAVVKRLRGEDRDFFLLLRYTGMYPSDLYALSRKHIVKDREEGWKIFKLREKAKYPTEIINQPLLPQIQDLVLEAYKTTKDPEDKLFVVSKSSPRVWGIMFKNRVGTAWKRSFPKKKVKKIKSLRHTFATWLMENDIPIDVAKDWMGHSKNSNTLNAVYLHRQSSSKYAKRLVGV